MRRVSTPASHVAVVGAGTSAVVADLIDAGYRHISAVDLSAAALDRLRANLVDDTAVAFIVADVRTADTVREVDVWHDRATFHFLIDDDDCDRYANAATQAVRPGGYVVLSVFGLDGPEQCSGLPVRRHDAASIARRLGPHFELVESHDEVHLTPWGAPQQFVTALLRRR